jgi:hypothetical protein
LTPLAVIGSRALAWEAGLSGFASEPAAAESRLDHDYRYLV